MPGRRWYEFLLVVAFAAGCRHEAGLMPPGACPRLGVEGMLGSIVVHRSDVRPALARVARDGDPRAAVAVLVVTGGNSYASTALSAMLESRVQRNGFGSVDSRADRDAFRLRALVETPERAVDFVRAVQRGISLPLAAGAPELALMGKRVAALRRHPMEAPIAASIARCTGELGVLPGDPPLDLGSNEGIAALESMRVAAYGAARVAFGVVGNASFIDVVGEAWSSSEKWPQGSLPEATWPADDEVGAFTSLVRNGGARLTLAMTAGRAENAIGAVAQAGGVDGALAARLRGLTVPFRIVEATGSARPRGGCAVLTLEALRPAPANGFEDASALAATIAHQELEGARHLPDVAERPDEGLSYEASRAVRAATDPREAAELAALWTLSTPAPSEHEHLAVALALPAPTVEPKEGSPDLVARLQVSTRRFSYTLDRLEKAWTTPVLERRDRLERGQGELWLLVASPCGVLAESETDAGTGALAVMTALATRARESRGVTLEPWITADGIGVIAHGERRPAESGLAQTERIAEEAARTLSVYPFAAQPFSSARAALLGRVGDGVAPDGRAMDALAGALVPGHPSWLAPLGSWEELARAGPEGTALRWAALTAGPLRVAILTNEGQEQADRAVRILDRWIVRSPSQPRACAPVELPQSPKPGTVSIIVASPAPLAQALVGIGVAPQGSPDSAWAELTLAALNGADGWLGKAFASPSFGAGAQARLVGGARSAALVVDIRASESSLDAAVAQVRALFERLRLGAMTASDFERSAAQRDRWDLEASLDPRRRLIDLWRDVRSPKSPLSLDGWKTWATAALRDEKLVVSIAKPRR